MANSIATVEYMTKKAAVNFAASSLVMSSLDTSIRSEFEGKNPKAGDTYDILVRGNYRPSKGLALNVKNINERKVPFTIQYCDSLDLKLDIREATLFKDTAEFKKAGEQGALAGESMAQNADTLTLEYMLNHASMGLSMAAGSDFDASNVDSYRRILNRAATIFDYAQTPKAGRKTGVVSPAFAEGGREALVNLYNPSAKVSRAMTNVEYSNVYGWPLNSSLNLSSIEISSVGQSQAITCHEGSDIVTATGAGWVVGQNITLNVKTVHAFTGKALTDGPNAQRTVVEVIDANTFKLNLPVWANPDGGFQNVVSLPTQAASTVAVAGTYGRSILYHESAFQFGSWGLEVPFTLAPEYRFEVKTDNYVLSGWADFLQTGIGTRGNLFTYGDMFGVGAVRPEFAAVIYTPVA
jgi:hypothetical protein